MDTQALNELRLEERPDKAVVGDTPMLAPERMLSREAYAMLAQANLLRMRGAWPESIEKCMAALRLSPDNPSAQSLLGDIYENQGRLDDAIQWYRMALDVQPDSPADRVKLARLLDLKARDLTVPLPVKTESPPETIEPRQKPPRWKADPDRLLRRFASIAGALAVLIVILALILAHRSGSLTLAGASRPIEVPTVVVPSVTSNPAAPVPGDSGAPVPTDPSEASLLNLLQSSSALTAQGVSILLAQIDPRTNRLTVTISYQPPPGQPLRRDLILRAATSVLEVAAQQSDPQTISRFTIRCLLAATGGGSTPLAFTADASRPALAALNPNPALVSTDQVTAVYTDPWWAPTPAQ